MKKTIKQILSALLVAVMLVSVMPITSFAEDDEKTFGYLKYTVTDGWITITNCDTSISGELVVPETIESYPVKRINRCAFSGCFDLTSIIIPDSVTIIDNSAFRGCSSLTSITIPDSVTIIGDRAFSGCPLTSIKISDNVTSIDSAAFAKCTSLTSITIPNNVRSIGGAALQIGSSTNKATITMLPTTASAMPSPST